MGGIDGEDAISSESRQEFTDVLGFEERNEIKTELYVVGTKKIHVNPSGDE